jgi:uncharacterized protein
MFAKPKLPSFPSASAFKSAAKIDPRAIIDNTVAFFKKPYVAPVTALATFALCLGAFLTLAGDPDAASPSVRIKLEREKAVSAHVNTYNAEQEQTFTLDAAGMFPEAGADAFANGYATPADGQAVITLPSDLAEKAVKMPKPGVTPLPQSPIAGLFQQSPGGPMPIIASNGMTVSSAYARPFKGDGRPMVALIVGGLGLNPATTREAIESLPSQVTLSFVPYTPGLQGWIDLARANGHEVIIEVPMQPLNYPDNDTGPQTLMANSRMEDLMARMNWVMSRASGYFAMSNYQGGAFFKDKAALGTFMQNLQARGIAFVDDGQLRGTGGAWGRASADRVVDSQINAGAINAQLMGLEQQAKSRGMALGTGFAYPVTVAVALKWTQELDGRGIQLAPASALLKH